MAEYPLRDESGEPVGKVTIDNPQFETPPSIGFSYERLPDGELEIKDFNLRSNDKVKLVPRVPQDFA